jgi:hypothetical protein
MESNSIRELIEKAKYQEGISLVTPVTVDLPDGVKLVVKRSGTSSPRDTEKEIDPANVCVVDENNRELAAMLVAQLIEIRAQKRGLDDQDAAIKNMLQDMAGTFEYLSLEEGEKPLISIKYESSIRIKSAAVKDQFPPEEFPDLYQQTNSRPLRIV